MGFREKMAWAMIVVLVGTGALYFSWVIQQSLAMGQVAPPNLGFMIGYVVLVVMASIVVAILIAATRPSEATPPLDDREKLIMFSGEVWSGRLLGFLTLVMLVDFDVYGDGNRLFHLIFSSLVVSQVVEYAAQIFFYRRGV